MFRRTTRLIFYLLMLVSLVGISDLTLAKGHHGHGQQGHKKGQRDVSAEIINGTRQDVMLYPFSGFMYDDSTGFMCGLSVIGPRDLATAAHCLEDTKAASFLTVYLGRTDYGSTDGTVYGVAHFRLDPAYKGDNHDFGYLRTSSDIDLSLYPAIALPESGDSYFAQPGSRLTAMGWGDISNGKNADNNYFNVVDVSVVSAKIAKKRYELSPKEKGGKHKKLSRHKKAHRVYRPSIFTFAAGGPSGDTCLGDSGGPVIGFRPDRTPVLVGITSMGGKKCASQQPGIYGRVEAAVPLYRQWMAE